MTASSGAFKYIINLIFPTPILHIYPSSKDANKIIFLNSIKANPKKNIYFMNEPFPSFKPQTNNNNSKSTNKQP